MGNPPRVGSFATSLATARWMETEWGAIRTIGLKPLVELKKTQRLEDYPVISKLALAWFDQAECAKTPGDLRWALQNIFTLPELRIFFVEHAEAVDLSLENLSPTVNEFGRQLRSGEDASESVERQANEWMQQRIADLQQADRRYWREVIAKLKTLRATRKTGGGRQRRVMAPGFGEPAPGWGTARSTISNGPFGRVTCAARIFGIIISVAASSLRLDSLAARFNSAHSTDLTSKSR